MDLVPVEKFQAGLSASECFRTPVILRIISQYLSEQDLSRLSTFNVFWSYEAIRVMRERTFITRDLELLNPCHHLELFAQEVHDMDCIPFNGISILFNGSNHYCLNQYESDPPFFANLNQVAWRHFSLTLHEPWTSHRNCPAILLAKRMLRLYGRSLERLTVQVDYEREQFVEEFVQQVVPVVTFPRLVSVFFSERDADNPSTSLLQALLVRAPRLQELHALTVVDLTDDLLQDSPACLMVDFPLDPLHNAVCETMINRIRCKKIQLQMSGHFNEDRLTRIAPSLLQSSVATLRAMEVDALLLAPLMTFGIVMETVVELKIFINVHHLTQYPQTWNFVKRINFSRMYPRLEHVHSVPSSSEDGAFWASEVNRIFTPAILPPSEPDRANNILNITLSPALDGPAVQHLAEMIPNVQNIFMNATNEDDIPFNILWENNWVNIAEITVRTFGRCPLGTVANLDIFFCGIDFVEVLEYLDWTDDELRSLKLVRKPCMYYKNGPRTFNLHYGRSNMFRGALGNRTTLLSRVTGLLVFERRGLTVNIHTDDHRLFQALDHLQPYANVQFTPQQNDDNDPADDDDLDEDDDLADE